MKYSEGIRSSTADLFAVMEAGASRCLGEQDLWGSCFLQQEWRPGGLLCHSVTRRMLRPRRHGAAAPTNAGLGRFAFNDISGVRVPHGGGTCESPPRESTSALHRHGAVLPKTS